MIQTAEKIITLNEFLKLPETKPASEYIEGEVIQKHNPQTKHSRIQAKLIILIEALAGEKKIALPFPELRCTFGGRSLVPDVVVLKWEHIPVDENGDIMNIIITAPDWTIEILSPDQSQTKVTKNILACLKNGCELGWLIDPEEKTIIVYDSKERIQFFEEVNQLLPVPEFLAELNLTVGEIFDWLKL
jgi:Uma2 family endonuclease